MMVKVSTKSKQEKPVLQPVTELEYKEKLDGRVALKEVEYLRAGKKVTPQLMDAWTKKVREQLSKEVKLKNTRLGHLHYAPLEVQDLLKELNLKVKAVSFKYKKPDLKTGKTKELTISIGYICKVDSEKIID